MSTAVAPPPLENSNGFTPSCPRCEYDLSGLPDGPCPECGTPFSVAELRAFWLALYAPNSEEALLRDFVATCPSCRYDLSGIPEGVCPECGALFTIAGLHNQWIAAKRRRSVSPSTLALIVAGFFQVIWFGIISVRSPDTIAASVSGGLAALSSAVWTHLVRERLLVRQPWLILFALAPLLCACTGAYRHLFWLGPLVAAPWMLGVLAAWAFCRGRQRSVPAIVVSVGVLAPGLLSTCCGTTGLLQHHHWSSLDETFPGSARRAFPPTTAEELALGIAYLAVGLLILAAGIRLRRPASDRPSTGHE